MSLQISGHSFARFSKSNRLVRGPFDGPASSVTIHLVARVLGELHGKALAAQPQYLDTGIDQRLRQPRAGGRAVCRMRAGLPVPARQRRSATRLLRPAREMPPLPCPALSA